MLVDSSLTCDYQGTELEELFGGMYSQTLILDSVYVEYLLFDTVVTYLPGCPDPVDIEVVLERSFLITGFNYTEGPNFNTLDGQISYLGYTRKLLSYFYPSMGIYYLFIHDYEVATLTSFSKESKLSPESVSMPFPESWTLDENGVQVDWNSWSWVSNSSNFRLIPYWHEAE
jgi:hypothetical protein